MSKGTDNSVDVHADLLTEMDDPRPERATILTEAREQLVELIGELKLETARGSVPRLFFNSLLQDLHIMEEATRNLSEESQDEKWLMPFLEALLAKLSLGAKLHPTRADRFHKAAEHLGHLRDRSRDWESVSMLLEGLIHNPSHQGLRREARQWLQQGEGLSALEELSEWSKDSGGPPLFLVSIGRVVEALSLHLALVVADGDVWGAHEESIQVTLETLCRWLEYRGVEASRPEEGKLMSHNERVIFRRVPLANKRRGTIDRVISPGYRFGKTKLASATVLVSPGTGSKVLEQCNGILEALSPDLRMKVEGSVEVLKQNLWGLLSDPDSLFEQIVEAALDLVEALRVIDQHLFEKVLIRAIQEDFDGTEMKLIAPSPGQRIFPAAPYISQAVYSPDIPSGHVTELLAFGVTLEGKVLREAKVLSSLGPPPANILDSLLETLRDEFEECDDVIGQLVSGRLNAPRDRSRKLAIELIRFALHGPEEFVEVCLETILDALLELELPALEEIEGWSRMAALLDDQQAAILEEESARPIVRCLLQPYLKALNQSSDNPFAIHFNRLSAALQVGLGPVEPPLRQAVLSWAWSELRFLPGEAGQAPSREAKQFLSKLSRVLSALWSGSDRATMLKRGLTTLESVGVLVSPGFDKSLAPCSSPETLFARFDARYHEEVPRGSLIGQVYPSVSFGILCEPGFARVSLGPKPRLLQWLKSKDAKQSVLAWSCKRLTADISNLDRDRLIQQIKGDLNAERDWRKALHALLGGVLKDSGWQNQGSSGPIQNLNEILTEDYQLDLLQPLD